MDAQVLGRLVPPPGAAQGPLLHPARGGQDGDLRREGGEQRAILEEARALPGGTQPLRPYAARRYLKFIKLNDRPIDFTTTDLSALLKANYDQRFLDEVYALKQVTQLELNDPSIFVSGLAYRLEYRDNDQFARVAKAIGIMEDTKSGVQRTAYLGIVSLMYRGSRLHIAPERPWKGYLDYG